MSKPNNKTKLKVAIAVKKLNGNKFKHNSKKTCS
jgi:hypothetical protein